MIAIREERGASRQVGVTAQALDDSAYATRRARKFEVAKSALYALCRSVRAARESARASREVTAQWRED